MGRKWTKRPDDFRSVISVLHRPTGTRFHTDGNHVKVITEDLTDEINTTDYEHGGNKVTNAAQLRAVAADWLNQQEEERNR